MTTDDIIITHDEASTSYTATFGDITVNLNGPSNIAEALLAAKPAIIAAREQSVDVTYAAGYNHGISGYSASVVPHATDAGFVVTVYFDGQTLFPAEPVMGDDVRTYVETLIRNREMELASQLHDRTSVVYQTLVRCTSA